MKTNTTFRQKDGAWQIIVSYKDGSRWRQKSRQGFPTKREAREAEADILKQIKNRPRPVDWNMAGITLMQFCELYTKVKKSITESTKQNYIDAVKSLRIVANRPVHMITYVDLQNDVSGWNTAPQTQRVYFAKIRILFRAAIKPYGLRTDDPTVDIELPRVRQKTERRTMTDKQFRLLMDRAHDDVRVAAAICYYTGLRRGDMLALTWSDIKDMTLTVSKQLVIRPKVHVAAPKSRNGFRTIPIPQALMVMLKEYHDSRPLDMQRRLFPAPTSTFTRLSRAIRSVDPGLSTHCLRHTYATNLLAHGVDIRTVAALLGDDVKTVIGTYVHYTDDMRQAAARDIQKIFAENF